jgi:hypothetical protein
MPKDRGYVEKVVQKAYNVITGNTTKGGAGQAARQRDDHYNEIDRINRELNDSAPQDTKHTQKIFEK